jgi:hypothetical protein
MSWMVGGFGQITKKKGPGSAKRERKKYRRVISRREKEGSPKGERRDGDRRKKLKRQVGFLASTEGPEERKTFNHPDIGTTPVTRPQSKDW